MAGGGTERFRYGACLAGALAALAIAAPSATAAQSVFGSDLNRTANGVDADCGISACDFMGLAFPSANLLPGTSPITGVVTKFLIRSSAQDTVDFRVFRPGSAAGKYTLAAEGPRIDLNGANVTQAVDARVPVATGDYIGYDDPTNQHSYAAVHCADGMDDGSYARFAPALAVGDDRTPTGSGTCELLVEAVAEPDADGDGFGDDSQDQCPGSAGANAGCPPPATAQAAAPFDRAAAIKNCKKKKRKKARKKCIKRVLQQP